MFKMFSDVQRCFQILTDVHICSLDVLWMFSRCFPDVFLGCCQDFSMMFLECSHEIIRILCWVLAPRQKNFVGSGGPGGSCEFHGSCGSGDPGG